MAIKKIIEVDINTNADEAAKEFDNVAKAVNVANDSLEGLNKTFEEANGDIQPLTARMGEAEDRLYELAAAGDTTSKEYQGLLNKVGEYRKVQIQTDLAVDNAAQTMSQKLGSALTGATSGFSVVQGSMALVGGESEQLEAALLKVNAAMALQQGIAGLQETAKSFGLVAKATKVWNLVLAANPIMLLVTALIAVIGYFAIFTDAIDVSIQALKDLGDWIGITNNAEQEKAEAQKERAKAQEERIKKQEKIEKEIAAKRKSRLDQELAQLQRKKQLEIDNFNRFLSFQESIGKSTAKLRKQRILDEIEEVKANVISKGRINNVKRSQQKLIELTTELNNVNKEIREQSKAASKEKQDNIQKEIELRQQQIDQEIAEEIALQKTFDEIQRENEDRFRTEQKNETLLVEEKYDALEASAQDNAEALEQIEIARLNELNDINLKYGDIEYQNELEKAARLKEINDKEIQDSIDGEEKKRLAKLKGIDDELNYAKQGADAIQQLGDLVFANKMSKLEKGSKEEEALARKQFKFNKALQLGGAIIDAGKAITASLAAAPIALVGVPNPAGIASLAFAATASATNIAKIASTKFESPGGSPDAPTPNIGGGGAPNFNVVGDSGVNQLATLQTQPTMAYVVSGEVTTAQALDRNRVQNATL